MISPDALIPSLRNAEPAEVPELLGKLDFEQIKSVARDIGGMKRIGKNATAESLTDTILKTLNAERSLAPERPALGAMVLDQESGEQVEITRALGDKVRELSDRLQQAEFSIIRNMAEICTVVKEFRDECGYLFFGYSSFKKYCDAGRLQVFGETRSWRWAYRQIQIVEALGDDLVPRVAPLPQRQLLKLAQVLSSDGMETTLEKLKGKLQLTYRDDSGKEATLALPESSEDVKQWADAIALLHRQAQSAKRGELAAEDTLVSERELHTREIAESSKRITELEKEVAEAQGRGEEILDELEKTDAAKLKPEDIIKLQLALKENRSAIKRAQADLRAAQEQSEALAGQLDKRLQLATDVGTLKQARSLCEEMIRKTDEAIEAVSELRAMGDDLPKHTSELAFDSAIRCESQFRQLADEFNQLKEEVA